MSSALRQVDVGFEDEDMGGKKDENAGQKKGVHDSDVVSTRHKAFLERCNQGTQSSWRPRPLHRVAAWKWLDNSDNQLKWLCTDQGMEIFLHKEDHEDWICVIASVLVCVFICACG